MLCAIGSFIFSLMIYSVEKIINKPLLKTIDYPSFKNKELTWLQTIAVFLFLFLFSFEILNKINFLTVPVYLILTLVGFLGAFFYFYIVFYLIVKNKVWYGITLLPLFVFLVFVIILFLIFLREKRVKFSLKDLYVNYLISKKCDLEMRRLKQIY